MTKSAKKTLAIGCIVLSTIFMVTHFTVLGINQSPSLPGKVFLTLKHSSFNRGDKVTIKGHRTSYYPDVRFTKIVAGVPGNKIIIKSDGMYVDDKKVGGLKKITLHGKPLTPLKANVIPKGYIFVAATHDRSFDSRYEEFGLVPIQKVIGRVIWSW